MPDLLLAGLVVELQRDMGAFGQAPHCIHERNIFVILHEAEHVAPFVTPEAVKNLPVRIDVEAGALLLMKRAKGHKIRARPFEREVAADDIDDVTGSANLFEGCRSDQSGHALRLTELLTSYQAHRKRFVRGCERCWRCPGPS